MLHICRTLNICVNYHAYKIIHGNIILKANQKKFKWSSIEECTNRLYIYTTDYYRAEKRNGQELHVAMTTNLTTKDNDKIKGAEYGGKKIPHSLKACI